MPETVLAADLRFFILNNINSVVQLEGLLLLQMQPNTPFTVEDISRRLYISEDDSRDLLSDLTERGFLAQRSKDSFIYQPRTPELQAMTERIVDAHSHHLVLLTKFIHSQPRNKVQKFADAFRIRKD